MFSVLSCGSMGCVRVCVVQCVHGMYSSSPLLGPAHLGHSLCDRHEAVRTGMFPHVWHLYCE